jgi:Predicted dithiol-disulfide isomerase involved in polyketide biosynthesis
MDTEDKIIEVIVYTDPCCAWCWGAEPVLRKIDEVLGGQVKVSTRMGGLAADIRFFQNGKYRIGGPTPYLQLADHWLAASQQHGMPVDARFGDEVLGGTSSTYPACIAYKASEFQGQDLARRYLRRLREAVAAERRNVQRLDVQLELAREVGLDADHLLSDLRNGRARVAFESDLEERRAQRVHELPTFRIRNVQNGRELLLRGHQQFGSFITAFSVLSDTVLAKQPVASEGTIAEFILRHGKVAPREIAVVFMVPENAIDKYLKVKLDEGLITKEEAGNGFFYKSRSVSRPRRGQQHTHH